jgi:hypothetical protein
MSSISSSPPVDSRTEAQLGDEVTARLRANVPEWAAVDRTGAVDQASSALIGIVSRFSEIVIERLNQAPDKNFLAFLDLLGTALLPPAPARVPLTFTVAGSSTTDAVVPAGTQVASPPGEGETAPVIFETERELTAVAARLQTLIAVDAERDLIADRSALIVTPAPDGVRAFTGDTPNEHVLYVACDALLSQGPLATLTLAVVVSAGSPAAAAALDVRTLRWEAWDGADGVPLAVTDTTQGLRVSGTLTFANVPQVAEQTVNGIRGRWLRCRLLTPVSPSTTPARGMVRASQLPVLASLGASGEITRTALLPDVAFANVQAVDVSKAFLPFGEKPKLGDTFYIGQRDALGQAGAAITIDVSMVNPVPDSGNGSSGSTRTTAPSSDLQLKWEVWTGTTWFLLGVTTPPNAAGGGGSSGGSLADDSKAFTRSKPVRFTLPETLAPTTVNGITSNWVRVQIAAGDYGQDALFVPNPNTPGQFQLVLATFAPPVLSALTLSSDLTTAPTTPNALVAFNNAQFSDLSAPLAAGIAAPFVGFPAQPPALYAAFALPPARKAFPNRAVSLYHGVRLPPYGETPIPLAPELSVLPGTPGATTEHHFTLTNASDESITFDLTVLGGAWASSVAQPQMTVAPGLPRQIKVTVTVPAVTQLAGPNVSDRGFLVLRPESETGVRSVGFETQVGSVAPRRRDLRYEYWNGSGWAKLVTDDGTELLTRAGVVEFLAPPDFAPSTQFGVNGWWIRALIETGDDPPVQLRTVLPNTTFATHSVTLKNEILGSSDASAGQQFETTRSPVLAGPQLEVREASDVWVRWVEVTDFYASTPQDRHYVLDHLAGEVRFGDGVQGRIPPRGVGNVRMARYQTGGGAIGNRAAGSIVQLKTTVPYVEKAINLEPADGGADAETTSALLTRAPRALRHGGRAVALEDFQDLARAASPEVARAKTVSLRDLRADPLSNTQAPGVVSVVIVPLSTDDQPLPSAGLIATVEDYLRSFATPTASIAVVGPLYVRVDVTAEIALVSLDGANAVEDAVRDALRGFLHPLTGGRDGAGWDFGRQPFLSDLYAVIGDVPGVDHVIQLSFAQVDEPPGAFATGRFLVRSGEHQISLTFLGAE